MTYSQFDVVVVPFPFTDVASSKRRPALVLSSASAFNERVGQSVMAMITTAKHSDWPLDTPLTDLKSAGLKAKSIVRMKLFTIDHQLIQKRLGRLGESDRASVQIALYKLLDQPLACDLNPREDITEAA